MNKKEIEKLYKIFGLEKIIFKHPQKDIPIEKMEEYLYKTGKYVIFDWDRRGKMPSLFIANDEKEGTYFIYSKSLWEAFAICILSVVKEMK